MGSRERKRVERQKRKRRSAQRPAAAPAPATEPEGEAEESLQERMSRRSEARNAEVRAGLEPLGEGERPGVVKVGAVISVVIALIFTVSAIVAVFSSAEIDGREPSPVPLAAFASVFWLMAWGMWKARYWAVLGFQMLLVLVLLSSAASLVAVETVLQVIGSLVLLAGSGTLFYFMIRAMARIQMPERPQGR